MAKAGKGNPEKKRGRPPGGREPFNRTVRVSKAFADLLNRYAQAVGKVSGEALEELVGDKIRHELVQLRKAEIAELEKAGKPRPAE